MHEALAAFGVTIPPSQLNLSLFLALAAAYGVWLLIYRSRLGYAIRVVGANPNAAVYAGISPARITIVARVVSGALAGGLAVNELMGYQHRLLLEFTSGYGFVGIAVALMGRAHPVGIVLASLLFGILYQGGAELAFEQPAITRDMVVVIGGIIILFAGALDGLFRRAVARVMARPQVARA
jgi:simple sugar transport system permease protein